MNDTWLARSTANCEVNLLERGEPGDNYIGE